MNDREGIISVRLATASDADLLARFRYTFRSSINSTSEGEEEFMRRCGPWMRERLREDSRWRCWIAERDQTPVGNLWMQLIEKIPNPAIEPEYHAYITNFYIQESARNKGIGTLLLKAALDWVKGRDVQAVILWPTEQSRSLYERHGFGVRADLLELMIAGEEEK